MATWFIEDEEGFGWAHACAVGTRQQQPWHSTGWNRAVAKAQGMSILIWQGAAMVLAHDGRSSVQWG